MSYQLDVVPSKDKKKVTITVTSEKNKIDVHILVKVLANYLKVLVESNGLNFEDVAVRPSDKVEVVE